MSKCMTFVAVVCVSSLFLVVGASADVITPVSATVSSEFSWEYRSLYGYGVNLAVDMINGSGLALGTGGADDTHADPTNPGYPADGSWHRTEWLATGSLVPDKPDNSPWAVFDLGRSCNLTATRIWNSSEANNFNLGVAEMEVLVSADNVNFTSLGMYYPREAINAGAEPAQDLALAANGVRYVKFNNMLNYGCSWGGTGFDEVRFVGAIPEPSALILVATAGFGLLAYAWRKRK